jgi:hypothetical protein
VGFFWHAYHSAWLPVSLLAENRQKELADALFAASRYWTVGLHFNKGLAGAPPQEIEAARNTATNPSALDAFALAIIAGGTETGPAVPGKYYAGSRLIQALICPKAIISNLTGSSLSGDPIIQSWRPLRKNMIPKDSFLFITEWGVRTGAKTDLPGGNNIDK